ncbi:hypothetical protein PIB30_082713 [Stylosanthes scabra]|uniref:Uncharacterized protein n=1 Tax=Stylosanthes scabra TaxID=79078 RepID=A0ABU6VSF1_9FABA|nr:hypothetical protein [Stylosanthes scabra]
MLDVLAVFTSPHSLSHSSQSLTHIHDHTYPVTTRRRPPPPQAPGALASLPHFLCGCAVPPVQGSLAALPPPLCPVAAPSSASCLCRCPSLVHSVSVAASASRSDVLISLFFLNQYLQR